MLSVKAKLIVVILTWFYYTVTLAPTEAHPYCNNICTLVDGAKVEICLFNDEDMWTFQGCCPLCQWVNFRNKSLGDSFQWGIFPNAPGSVSSHTYGQYNCVNQSNNNTIVRRVFTIPQSK